MRLAVVLYCTGLSGRKGCRCVFAHQSAIAMEEHNREKRGYRAGGKGIPSGLAGYEISLRFVRTTPIDRCGESNLKRSDKEDSSL